MNVKLIFTGALLILIALALNFLPSAIAAVIHYESGVTPLAGYFTINGEQVTPTTEMWVTDPNLDIRFIATAGGDQVGIVKLYIFDISDPPIRLDVGVDYLTEEVADSEWKVIYTLPYYGDFLLEARVEVGDAWHPDIYMSVIAEFDAEGISIISEQEISWVTFLSWTLGIAGAAMVFIGAVKPQLKLKRRR